MKGIRKSVLVLVLSAEPGPDSGGLWVCCPLGAGFGYCYVRGECQDVQFGWGNARAIDALFARPEPFDLDFPKGLGLFRRAGAYTGHTAAYWVPADVVVEARRRGLVSRINSWHPREHGNPLDRLEREPHLLGLEPQLVGESEEGWTVSSLTMPGRKPR